MKEITIKQIEKKDKEFIAYFKSEFLKATFSVCFKDNIVGAVALNNFYEMIRHKFGGDKLELVISNESLRFESKAMLDTLFPSLRVANNTKGAIQ